MSEPRPAHSRERSGEDKAPKRIVKLAVQTRDSPSSFNAKSSLRSQMVSSAPSSHVRRWSAHGRSVEAITYSDHLSDVARVERTMDVESGGNRTLEDGDEKETIRLVMAQRRKGDIHRRGEKWADKLAEETVTREEFKRALRYLSTLQYTTLTHERHLNSLCSYSTCSRPPASEWRPGKRFVISSSRRTITEVMGNADEGYCSSRCRKASEWVEKQLAETGVMMRGKEWDLLLAEEVTSGKLQDGKMSRQDGAEAAEISLPLVQSEIPIRRMAPAQPNVGDPRSIRPDETTGAITLPQSTESLRPVTSGSPHPNSAASIIANLSIHERPFPSRLPPPPSFEPSLHFCSPSPTTSTTPLQALTPVPDRRGPTSLLAPPTKLAQTLMTATKSMGPMRTLDPGSESEGEDEELAWEKEAGLGWGNEGEMRDIWEEAKAAREMMG